MADVLNDRQKEFLDKFHRLMSEFQDVVGPVVPDDDPENGVSYTAEELASMQPVRNAGLSEWMILSAWMDLDDGEVYTSAFTLPGMPTHHRTGLLLTWLETWK